MTISDIQTKTQVSQDVIDSFRSMWDHFPHPVLLLQVNRTIVAVNKNALDLGVTPGIKCFQLTRATEIHSLCKADDALKAGESKRSTGLSNGRFLDSYWLPIDGQDGLYIHFAIDFTEYAKDEILKQA